MAKENWDIKFIKPCRFLWEEHRLLTAEYTHQAFFMGKIVQINLDNCSIQRMEQLTENSTPQDVEVVGLGPLYEILQKGVVSLTCIGINEMPDWRVENARAAYERFCRKFWPKHQDDKDATYRQHNPNCDKQKVQFSELSDNARCVYGIAYLSILQIQNIYHNYPKLNSDKKFEIYLHSMIGLLDILSGFEIEIAKWAFWSLEKKEINRLNPTIKQRRKDIKSNFFQIQTNISKCREFAFNAAMDLHWISGSNLSEDLNHELNINGDRFKLDNWVGTNDHKLYRISRDVHSTYYDNSTMKKLVVTREEELESNVYWKTVDRISEDILNYRYHMGYSNLDLLLVKIDNAVSHIEGELINKFNSATV